MGYKEESEKLENRKKELKAKLSELNEQWEKIEESSDEVEEQLRNVTYDLDKLREDNEREGFEAWKAEQSEDFLNKTPRPFEITREQLLKVRYLESLHANKNQGAIGGGTTFNFTPTSIGDIVTVTIGEEEFELTDYSTF